MRIRVFGDFKVVDEVEVALPYGKIMFKRIDESYLRIIKTVNASVSSKLVSLGFNELVSLRPKQPSGNVIEANYLMVKFPEPLTLLPRSSISFSLQLPVDLGVYIGSTLVDSAPVSKVKYALYGPSDLGDLCRYVDKNIVNSTPKEFLGDVTINITSAHDGNLSVTKVVVPLDGLVVFVLSDDRLRFNEVSVRCLSQQHAEVSTSAKAPIPLNEIKYMGKAKESSYVMRHGV